MQKGQEEEGSTARSCFSDFIPQPRAPRAVKAQGNAAPATEAGPGKPVHTTSPGKHSDQRALPLQLRLGPLTSTTTSAREPQLHFLAKTTNSRVVKQVSKIPWHRLLSKSFFPLAPRGFQGCG